MYRLVKPTVLSDVSASETQAAVINLIAFGRIHRMHVQRNPYTVRLKKREFQTHYLNYTNPN
jgi:hypothetical protein